MRREDIDTKVNEFNSKLGQLEFDAASFDIDIPLSQLEKIWQTTNSVEVLGNMNKKINNMQEHIYEMQSAVNALRGENLSVFYVSETTRTENAPNPNANENVLIAPK